MLVLDASVCAPWFLADEHHPTSNLAETALRNGPAVCPQHWPLEMGNLLLSAVRRGRLEVNACREALRQVEALPIVIEAKADLVRIADLAGKHALTFYDAGYLEIALRHQGVLGTLDKALARAAQSEGVPLIE